MISTKEGERVPINTSVPIVFLDRRFSNYKLISTDHIGGSAQFAGHLFRFGHRRIAYISGQLSIEVGRLKKGFYDQLMHLVGHEEALDLASIEGQFDYSSGEEITCSLLSVTKEKRVTAITTASDQQAIGALRAACDLNRNVAQELSIIGFDDIALTNLFVPRLTTVSQNTAEMARVAVYHLLTATSLSATDHDVIGTVLK